jgi:hypothetical protein
LGKDGRPSRPRDRASGRVSSDQSRASAGRLIVSVETVPGAGSSPLLRNSTKETAMKLSHLALPFVLSFTFVAAGCSGSDGEINVEAASAALTDKGQDSLFTIKVVAARDDGYSLEGLVVKATPEDKDAIVVACNANDANGNKTLDKDESLGCAEGAENQFDATLAGKEIKVELFAQIDGKEERVGESTWKPAN